MCCAGQQFCERCDRDPDSYMLLTDQCALGPLAGFHHHRSSRCGLGGPEYHKGMAPPNTLPTMHLLWSATVLSAFKELARDPCDEALALPAGGGGNQPAQRKPPLYGSSPQWYNLQGQSGHYLSGSLYLGWSCMMAGRMNCLNATP